MAILNNTQINGQLNVEGGMQVAEIAIFNSAINKTFSDGVYSPITTSADGKIIPEKWTFDYYINPNDEDEVTIKIPSGNRSTAGIFLSLDNGEHYYPILLKENKKLTTQFSAESYLSLIFHKNEAGRNYSFYPIEGGTTLSTYAKGNWEVINYCEESESTLKLSTARTLWGQSFDGSKDIDGNILDAGNITSLENSTYTIGSSVNHWKTGYFDELLVSSDTKFTTVAASIGYVGTSIKEGAIELSGDNPYIDFHYNHAAKDYSVRLTSDAENQFHIMGSGTPASIEYNNRTIRPLTFHSGIFYCNNNIETSNSFISNRSQPGNGFALYTGDVQCGVMYVSKIGTSDSVGNAILSAGNSLPEGQVFNARGIFRLYSINGYRTDIMSQPLKNDSREAQVILFPKYNDDELTLSHTGGDAAVGSSTKPVYVEQYGRITASNATIGNDNQPIFMNNGTLTASSATVGNGVQFIYLENGIFKPSTETVGNNKKLMFLKNGELKVSSATVGSTTQLVFLNNGTFTASEDTVGSSYQPTYLSDGEITPFDQSVGSNKKHIFMKDGVITASNASVGSETQPIFMKDGEITESDHTVGNDNQPIYLKNGNFSVSSANIGSLTAPIYMENGVFKTCELNLLPSDLNLGNKITPVYIENGEFKSGLSYGEVSFQPTSNYFTDYVVTESNYSTYLNKITNKDEIITTQKLAAYRTIDSSIEERTFSNFEYYTSPPFDNMINLDSNNLNNFINYINTGWYNTNQGVQNTISAVSFKVKENIGLSKIKIEYCTGSESGCDYLYVLIFYKDRIDFKQLIKDSGSAHHEIVNFSSEEVVESIDIIYKKDGSLDKNGDSVGVKLTISGATGNYENMVVADKLRGKDGNNNKIAYYNTVNYISAASNHYIDDDRIAINRTSKPNENFYVNGTSYFKGRASFEDLVIPTSEPDDPQPGSIWIS